ncbi:RDD family protein [Bacillus suaedae]|uniref:RDD family protein n=1 Tax=Halalkalibacter suaedae TaxID=2822140 RepID=A0A941AQD6_9BACI|nr:RDD family protein [Bacillus suaedae]MBP3952676.1 RDD family protein [Bacillus suaedae]
MSQEKIEIKTPEYVSLQYQTAGLGSRASAFIIDQIIITIVNIAMVLFFVFVMIGQDNLFIESSTVPIAIMVISIFLVNWGYFFAVEYFSGGRTIGKKMIGIRVIQENGHSITLLASFIRNLLRIIDQLPASYLLGMTMVFLHSKHKRLGDIVAGTIVVHERRKKQNKKMTPLEKEIERRGLSLDDLVLEEWAMKAITAKEWDILKTYSERLSGLPLSERKELTAKVGNIILVKVGLETGDKTETELENMLLIVYLKLREEWEFEL